MHRKRRLRRTEHINRTITMQQLKSIFILVLLLLSGQSKAQEAVIEDVSFLVQYIKGDTENTIFGGFVKEFYAK